MPAISDTATTVEFEPDEWIVVRYCYGSLGHAGPGSALMLGGPMDPQGFADTQSMLSRWRESAALRPLNANIANGQGAASDQASNGTWSPSACDRAVIREALA